MFLRDSSLQELETLVHGYYAALSTHGLIERVPEMTNHFSTWLYCRTKWSMSLGWADAIISNARARPPLEQFFELVDHYRKLRPVTLRSARLGKRNAPTGRRVTIGTDGRIERPMRVDIVRYAPTRLHFLRFFYRGHVRNNSILMRGDGSHETSLGFAKQWMEDELQTRDRDWS